MKIIRNRQIDDDPWQQLSDDEKLSEGDVIVSLARWQAEKQELLKHDSHLGVELLGSDKVEEIIDDLDKLSLIALNFDRFTDGRGYSQARLLRDKYHYTGAIRAVGDIRRDQIEIGFMSRCGTLSLYPPSIAMLKTRSSLLLSFNVNTNQIVAIVIRYENNVGNAGELHRYEELGEYGFG